MTFVSHFCHQLSVNSGAEKVSVWFQGGIHAYEWVAPAAVMHITNEVSINTNKPLTRTRMHVIMVI